MLIPPAFAQSAGAAGSSSGSLILFGVQMAALFAVFYFLMLRPQQKKQKEHRARLNAVKKNDSIVTAGGLVAKVTRVIDDQFVEAEIAQGVKVKVVKATITDIVEAGTKPAND